MRATLSLNDELLATAEAVTGLSQDSGLLDEALRALIERESARHLVRLGGSQPNLQDIPRRRVGGE